MKRNDDATSGKDAAPPKRLRHLPLEVQAHAWRQKLAQLRTPQWPKP
jgi:hypothetical protein